MNAPPSSFKEAVDRVQGGMDTFYPAHQEAVRARLVSFLITSDPFFHSSNCCCYHTPEPRLLGTLGNKRTICKLPFQLLNIMTPHQARRYKPASCKNSWILNFKNAIFLGNDITGCSISECVFLKGLKMSENQYVDKKKKDSSIITKPHHLT